MGAKVKLPHKACEDTRDHPCKKLCTAPSSVNLVAVATILLLLIIKFLAEPDLESRSPYYRMTVILKLHLDHIELLWVP